ncbi:MAG TPA: GntR family transcriptional regulator [Candidatus Dormibacteraeota bacterium]|jgi:GntR family transcriptional regulator|nr:GntR family transcriptional regulator [Candidatus Dormibacteraeota bacterium]
MLGTVRTPGPSQPTYLTLADEIEATIARRPPGSALPSEHELARQRGVNRLTARAALDELERRHLVRRSQGRGTFVAHRVEYRIAPDLPPSWSHAVRLGGANPGTRTERLRLARGPRWARELLEVDGGAQLLHLLRLRTVDGEPAACADTWLVAELVPGLAARLPEDGSLHRTLDEEYRLRPVRTWARAELVTASSDVAQRIGVSGRPAVYELRALTGSAARRRPVEVTTSWLRADIFRVVFEMGRTP